MPSCAKEFGDFLIKTMNAAEDENSALRVREPGHVAMVSTSGSWACSSVARKDVMMKREEAKLGAHEKPVHMRSIAIKWNVRRLTWMMPMESWISFGFI